MASTCSGYRYVLSAVPAMPAKRPPARSWLALMLLLSVGAAMIADSPVWTRFDSDGIGGIMIETKVVPPTPYPTGFLWWFRNGDSWSAPEINNGQPYLPGTPQWQKNIYWAFRNPIGNF